MWLQVVHWPSLCIRHRAFACSFNPKHKHVPVQVPVVFFSLLRKGTPDRDRSETKLADAFDYVSEGRNSRTAA
jgi:hypothetical protein